MDREHFRARLAALGYTCREFAAISGYSDKTVQDFGARYPVPYIVRNYLAVIEQLQHHHIPLPPAIQGQERTQMNGHAQKILRATLDTF